MKKIFNLLLILTLSFMLIGSTFNNVDASAGSNNKTLTMTNLYYNNVLDDSSIDVDDVLYGNGYSIGGVLDTLTENRFGIDYNDIVSDAIAVNTSVDDTWLTGAAFALTNVLGLGAKIPVSNSNIVLIAIVINNEVYQVVAQNTVSAVGEDVNTISMATSGTLYISFNDVASKSIIKDDTLSVETYLQANDVLFIYELDTYVTKTYDYTYIELLTSAELPYLYNLTEIFGEGNEPTELEFETLLADAPDYFETYDFNYYIDDDTIIEVDCQRTAVNLIDNGDFTTSDVTNWRSSSLSSFVLENNSLKTTNISDTSVGSYYSLFTDISHSYYYSTDIYPNNIFDNKFRIINVTYDTDFIVNEWNDYSIIATGQDTSVFRQYFIVGNSFSYYLDNIMVFDLTEMYGLGNEPTYEEWEFVMTEEVYLYADEFTFNDTCYMTVEQNSPMYMYSDYIENRTGTLDITMTDSIKDLPVTNPHITIEKYDLDMNYVGNLYSGNITDYNDDNADGYLDHTFTYNLPDPITTEEGYIYVAYDLKDENILASGYLYNPVSPKYISETGNNAIGVNDSVYENLQEEYQYSLNATYSDYMFNEDNHLVTHIRYSKFEANNTDINYYNESTDQYLTMLASDIYDQFCDVLEGGAFVDVYECYFYSSSGSTLPPLFNFLQSSNIAHISYLTTSLEEYILVYDNFFYDAGYADNQGVYTYNLENVEGIFGGQSPIFNFDNFNTFSLVSHSVKEGGVLRARMTKPDTYLDDAFEVQYLFDNNTSVYYYNIDGSQEQEFYLEVFFGLTPEDATVSYHLVNDGTFRNGVDGSNYNTTIYDSYVMREIIPFTDKVDNALDVIGLNDAIGKIFVSALVIIFVTIITFLLSRKVLITLLMVFLSIALLMVLGIIPTWIMLFILVVLLVSVFLKRKGGE